MSEMKQIMRFMWGNKKMRRTFCCGFELLGAGGILLLMTIAASIPVVMGLLGMEVNGTVQKWTYGLAFVFGVALLEFLVEIPFAIYGGAAGKGMGGIPHAKGIMTKGIVVNLMIFYGCCLVVLLGVQGIGIALGGGLVSLLDDSLFLFGLFYFLQPILHSIWGGLNRMRKKNEVYSGVSVIALIVMFNAFGKLDFSLPVAVGFQVAFFVFGTGLMYPVLVTYYKNREVVVLQ